MYRKSYCTTPSGGSTSKMLRFYVKDPLCDGKALSCQLPCMPVGLVTSIVFCFPVTIQSFYFQTIKYKLPPFYKQCLSFLGFSKEEQNHMEEVTIENGKL